jgi:hypothetical protein
MDKTKIKIVETCPSKTLKINTNLIVDQEKKMSVILKNHILALAWDYKDMKGIHLDIFTHHIYIKDGFVPIWKPQKRMNPTLKDIFKRELQKLLDSGFIYPIFYSEWVSPFIIVPKKNGKWRECVWIT